MTESIVRPAKMPYGRLKDNGFVGIEGEHAARALVVETKDDLSAFASINLIIDDLDCGAMTKTTSGGTTTLSMTLTSSMIGRSGRKICQLIMVNSGNTVVQKSSQFEAYVGRANEIERSVDDGVTIIILSEAVTEMAREAAAAAAEEAVADVVEDCQAIADAASASADAAAQSASDAQTAAASIVVDATLDSTSTHAIQNKVVASEIAGLKADLGDNVNDLKSTISNISVLNHVSLSYVEGGFASHNNLNKRIITTSANARYAEISITEKYTAYHVITAIGGSIKAVLFFDASDNLISFVPPESDIALQEFYVEVPDTASKMYINSIKLSGAFVDSQVEQILTASTMEGRQNILSATIEQDVNYFEMGNNPYNTPITEIGTYNAIIKNSLNIDATTVTLFVLKKYPVSSGRTYRVVGNDVNVHYDTYGIAVFSTTSYDGTTSITGTTAIIGTGTGATNTDYDVAFTAPSNGYIYIMRYGSQNYCEVYDTEYNSALINRLTNTTTDMIKIQAFGDSITDDSWRSDETTWLTLLPNFLTQRTLSIKNEAVGGARIGHGKVTTENAKYHNLDYNFVYDLITNPTIFDPNSDIIVMFVGTNDFGSGRALGQWGDTSVDTFYGAARTICEYVAANTSALFLVVTPIARPDDEDTGKAVNADGERVNSNGATLRDYADALIRTCNFYQFPVIDLFHDIGWNKTNVRAYLDSVGVHPSKKGSAVISAYISSVMNKHLGI